MDLDLREVESASLAASSQLKALKAEQAAAREREKQAFTLVLPRLAADGNWRYLTEVPSFKVSPSAPSVQFGDHNNYSVGLGATWTFFDLGAWQAWSALEAAARAKDEEVQLANRQVLLKARLDYFLAQLASEKVRLLADSLKLAQAQARDIELKFQAGAASRIDALSAKDDALQQRGEFRQARADLAVALADLFSTSGMGQDADLKAPLDSQSASAPPSETEPATLVLKLGAASSGSQALQRAASGGMDLRHPQVLVFREAAESARHAAAAATSGWWPRLQAGFRSSLDYPNGPILEQVQQNTLSVGAVWPLFSFGQTVSQVEEQKQLAASQEARGSQALADLKSAWQKSQARLAALKARKTLDGESVDQNQTLYRLVTAAYKAGSARYLEVRSALLRALESKVRLAETETQMLIELAQLASLTEQGEPE
jgi:outer membrane protein TolC